MLKEFPGGVWIDPSEIVGLAPALYGGKHADISATLRGGAVVRIVCPEPIMDQNKPTVEAEAWIRGYLAKHQVNRPPL